MNIHANVTILSTAVVGTLHTEFNDAIGCSVEQVIHIPFTTAPTADVSYIMEGIVWDAAVAFLANSHGAPAYVNSVSIDHTTTRHGEIATFVRADYTCIVPDNAADIQARMAGWDNE